MLFTIIIFIITLLVLVVSHEFGHFIMARKFGIRVLEFGFGIPPRVWGKKIGETLVSINWLPLGGFVRLLGEDEVDEKILQHKDSFAAKLVWQRSLVVTAGVLMNLFLAAVIFWVVLAAQGFKEKIPLLSNYHFFGVSQVNESVILVGQVAPSSPADNAGIKSTDRILKFNDVLLQDADQLIVLTKQYGDQVAFLTLVDGEEKQRVVQITPRKNPPEGQGPLGVSLGTMKVAYLNYQSLSQKLFSGPVHTYNLAVYSLSIFRNLIAQSIATRNLEPVSSSVTGPVGITNLTATILQTKNPVLPYLSFVALLSLNLAIVNILPFPALDGGRLLFLFIEGIFRKKVRADIEKFIHTAGMIILLGLIVLITFSDIRKLF